MMEDDDYRASSQYRYWSYTKEQLVEIRKQTNAIAADRVRAAFARSRASTTSESTQNDQTDSTQVSLSVIHTLSAEEELKIVEWGGSKIMEMGKVFEPRLPSHVLATAIQYLRRFYLTNSPMTYQPKQIVATALFLATKSDHYYIALHKFVKPFGGNVADVKAPEFLLLQGLRFTLDVRHPMRALEGGVSEMQALAKEGLLGVLDHMVDGKKQSAAFRIGRAADAAKNLIVTAAQMTDAYFRYTPSQIWLAAIFAVDTELVSTYLNYVFQRIGKMNSDINEKLHRTISECADMLSSYVSLQDDPARAKEVRKLGKKLNACQNPEKLDMVVNAQTKAAEKREGSSGNAEKVLKKRRMEREKLEQDGEVFGPGISKVL